IARVVFAYLDPNPKVAGKGQQVLRAAGIVCDHMPLPEITEFYEAYHHYCQTGLPLVTGKIALSLDGKTAGPQQQRVQITGDDFKRFTHQQR
ncbi:riboflavin biosynthesis protein RibD, partial [Acinetobacter baumannii]